MNQKTIDRQREAARREIAGSFDRGPTVEVVTGPPPTFWSMMFLCLGLLVVIPLGLILRTVTHTLRRVGLPEPHPLFF